MEWTEEQRKIIELRGKSALVSAAAGSGKTAVLVERIRRLVIEDRVPLDAMLVVTFTEAAAAEMRQKITDAVSGELDQGDDPFLREQVQRIYGANISTFHAFALTILRKYYFIIDREPAMNICDDFRREFLMGEALDTLFDEAFETGDADFLAFLRDYAGAKNEDSVRNMIRETYDFILSMPAPFQWLEQHAEGLAADDSALREGEAFRWLCLEIRRELAQAQKGLSDLGCLLLDGGVPSLAAKNETDLEAVTALLHAMEQQGFEAVGDRMASFTFARFSLTKADKENYEAIRPLAELRRGRVKKRITALKERYFAKPLAEMAEEIAHTRPAARTLRGLVLRFHDLFSALKQRDGLIDFSDIEHLTLRILEEEQVRREYREKFRYIFIDEYQDSNYIQETLIDRIRGQDNVFMVGDIKQSIYKFRLAEPEIFIEKYNRFSAPATDESESPCIAIDLNRNFRSKQTVLREINTLFRRLMDVNLSGIAYDEKAELRLGLDYETRWDHPAELILVDKVLPEGVALDSELAALKDTEREAMAAADLIERVRGTPFFDVKQGRARPMEYRDMVVLLRATRSAGAVWYEILLNRGIPAYSDSGDGYFDSVEIETFVNLLRVIDNTRQDVPLVSLMYSPIFGFTTEQLIHIRLRHREGAYHAAWHACVAQEPGQGNAAEGARRPDTGEPSGDTPGADVPDVIAEKCRQMAKRLAGWRQDEQFMELPDFLWTLMKESGYYDYVGALAGGEQRRANLRALVDKAAAFQSEKIRGLFDFIRYIDTIRLRKISMGQVKLLSENDDVVRITTIHKSKGLEYPMVILGQMGKRLGGPGGMGRVSLHKDLGLALQWEDYESHTWRRTLLQRILARRKAAEERAEEIRVLYVAMTRAMDRLVMIGAVKDGDAFLEVAEVLEGGADTDVMAASTYLDMLQPVLGESGIKTTVVHTEELQGMTETARRSSEALGGLLRQMAGLQMGGPSEDDSSERSGRAVGDTQTDIPAEGAADSALSREVNRRLSWVYPFAGALKLKSKYSVSELTERRTKEDEAPSIITAGQTKEDGALSTAWARNYFIEGSAEEIAEDAGLLSDARSLTAAQRGSALHKAFERLDYPAAFAHREERAFFEAFLNQLAERQILSAEEREGVHPAALQRFARTPLFARAARSPRLRKEAPFNLRRRKEGEEIIVQGIIDCFFAENGKFVLIDFKSGALDRNDPEDVTRVRARYTDQINLYREALETILNVPVDEAFLYMTKTGDTLEIQRP